MFVLIAYTYVGSRVCSLHNFKTLPTIVMCYNNRKTRYILVENMVILSNIHILTLSHTTHKNIHHTFHLIKNLFNRSDHRLLINVFHTLIQAYNYYDLNRSSTGPCQVFVILKFHRHNFIWNATSCRIEKRDPIPVNWIIWWFLPCPPGKLHYSRWIDRLQLAKCPHNLNHVNSLLSISQHIDYSDKCATFSVAANMVSAILVKLFSQDMR